MQTVRPGDRVRVHYVKRFQDGSVASSHGRAPLQLTVGRDCPRLPGLGLALVGLAPGASTFVHVPPEKAYGAPDPTKIRRWARSRFPEGHPLRAGEWVRVLNRLGRSRRVRIVEIRGRTVLVDTNHRRAGQALELEVELVGILPPRVALDARDPVSAYPAASPPAAPSTPLPTENLRPGEADDGAKASDRL